VGGYVGPATDWCNIGVYTASSCDVPSLQSVAVETICFPSLLRWNLPVRHKSFAPQTFSTMPDLYSLILWQMVFILVLSFDCSLERRQVMSSRQIKSCQARKRPTRTVSPHWTRTSTAQRVYTSWNFTRRSRYWNWEETSSADESSYIGTNCQKPWSSLVNSFKNGLDRCA